MKEETYVDMITKLQSILNDCTDVVNRFGTRDNFVNNLTISEVKSLVEDSKKLLPIQSKVIKEEFTHILCMCNLTTYQEMVLIRLIKALSKTRPYIEYISSYKIDEPGVFKKSSNYKCENLGISASTTRVSE